MACRWLIPLLNHPCTSSASLVVHWYGLRSAFAFTNDVEMESQAAARVRGPKSGRLAGASRARRAADGRARPGGSAGGQGGRRQPGGGWGGRAGAPCGGMWLRAADVAPPFFAGRMTEQAAVGFAKMRRGLKAAGHRDLHDAQAAVREQFLGAVQAQVHVVLRRVHAEVAVEQAFELAQR